MVLLEHRAFEKSTKLLYAVIRRLQYKYPVKTVDLLRSEVLDVFEEIDVFFEALGLHVDHGNDSYREVVEHQPFHAYSHPPTVYRGYDLAQVVSLHVHEALRCGQQVHKHSAIN